MDEMEEKVADLIRFECSPHFTEVEKLALLPAGLQPFSGESGR